MDRVCCRAAVLCGRECGHRVGRVLHRVGALCPCATDGLRGKDAYMLGRKARVESRAQPHPFTATTLGTLGTCNCSRRTGLHTSCKCHDAPSSTDWRL